MNSHVIVNAKIAHLNLLVVLAVNFRSNNLKSINWMCYYNIYEKAANLPQNLGSNLQITNYLTSKLMINE